MTNNAIVHVCKFFQFRYIDSAWPNSFSTNIFQTTNTQSYTNMYKSFTCKWIKEISTCTYPSLQFLNNYMYNVHNELWMWQNRITGAHLRGAWSYFNCMKKRFEVKEKSKRSSHRIFVNGSCALFWSGLISWVDRPKEVFNLKPVYWFMSANLPIFLSIFKPFAWLYILFINRPILNVYFH